MTENEQKWLDLYMETGDGKHATRQVFDCSEESVPSRTSQLKKKLSSIIDQRLRDTFAHDSVKMLNILKGLAVSANSEQVKLKAVCDWLDRGGYRPVHEIHKTEEYKSESQIRDKLSDLTKGLPEEVRMALMESTSRNEH